MLIHMTSVQCFLYGVVSLFVLDTRDMKKLPRLGNMRLMSTWVIHQMCLCQIEVQICCQSLVGWVKLNAIVMCM